MPFEVTNAHVVFMDYMNQIFQPYLDQLLVTFIDDILIYYHTQQEHGEILTTILLILQENKLFAKLIICVFWMTKVNFLGYIISKGGILMDPSKVKAIINWERSENASEFRSF